jgi:short-subunit dehydrogenase
MKNIIVTGTSRGIGYELALKFANVHHVLAISRKHSNFIENKTLLVCL